jgi:2-iminoacetate synthase ThiH
MGANQEVCLLFVNKYVEARPNGVRLYSKAITRDMIFDKELALDARRRHHRSYCHSLRIYSVYICVSPCLFQAFRVKPRDRK